LNHGRFAAKSLSIAFIRGFGQHSLFTTVALLE
jgi:hypothetical protein